MISFLIFYLIKLKKKGLLVVSFSYKKKADIFLLKTTKNKNNYKLKISVKNKIFHFNINQNTESFTKNILACISVLYVLNLDLIRIKKEFVNFGKR